MIKNRTMATKKVNRMFFTESGFQPQSKRREAKLSEMSPEARRAMLLAREDSKENFLTISKPLQPTMPVLGLHSPNLDGGTKQKSPLMKNERRDVSAEASGHSEPSLRPSRATQPTARSRSTLSHTDHNSERNERRRQQRNYSKDGRSTKRPTTAGKSIVEETAPNTTNNVSVDDEADYKSSYATEGDDWASEDCLSVATGDAPNDPSTDSFAVALHHALNHKGAERLRGDITDEARISQPGTVRALNGGRLNNAQEVVVNVCHDDGKELVFHDDDEDSLETARTISQIRINVWLEYNEKFQNEWPYEHGIDSEDSSASSNVPKFPRSQTSTALAASSMGSRATREKLKGKPPIAKPSPINSKPLPPRTRSAMPTGGAMRSKSVTSPHSRRNQKS